MRPLAIALFALNLLAAAALVSAGPARAADAPIRVALTGPLGQHVTALVAGKTLQEAEYKVEFVEVPADEQFARLAKGEVHLQPEVWTETAGPGYQAALEARGIARLGKLGIQPPSVIKVAWRNAAIKWSGAIKMMRTMSISDADRDGMIAAVEQRGLTPDAAVDEWMAANQEVWQSWMGANRNWMTPD